MLDYQYLSGWKKCLTCANTVKIEVNMITRQEILMGRDKQYPLNEEQENNLNILLERVNKLRQAYGKPMIVSSGYRPAAINANVPGAAKRSNHLMCAACDFRDTDGKIDEWCMANLDKLEEMGLWLEHPDATKGWCHVQIFPPRSGNRVFRP